MKLKLELTKREVKALLAVSFVAGYDVEAIESDDPSPETSKKN